MYRTLNTLLLRFLSQATLFKYGFNLSPMYRRSTGRVTQVSPDLRVVEVEIRLSWRNVNYVGSMFGGSLLSATDPILMIQLLHLLGDDYIVWDKAVQMRFRRPARTHVTARFEFTEDEVETIRQSAEEQGEMDWEKAVELVDTAGAVVASGTKTLYVATKAYRRQKDASRAAVPSAERAAEAKPAGLAALPDEALSPRPTASRTGRRGKAGGFPTFAA